MTSFKACSLQTGAEQEYEHQNVSQQNWPPQGFHYFIQLRANAKADAKGADGQSTQLIEGKYLKHEPSVPQWFVGLFVCLTGSDPSPGVTKPPRLNLTPKPPVRNHQSDNETEEEDKAGVLHLSLPAFLFSQK